MKKILISTGGTGGHVIPAKIIEEHLRNNFEIYYSTDVRGLKYLSSEISKILIIDTPKINLSLYLPFRLIKLIYLIFQVYSFLKKERIDKVISIGGYMSIPVVVAAKILGLCDDEIRLPLVKIKKETQDEVKKALSFAKLI